jgi:hypothetical protein
MHLALYMIINLLRWLLRPGSDSMKKFIECPNINEISRNKSQEMT